MKKLFAKTLAVVVFVIVAAVQVMAQNGFAYQAVIRDSEGNLVTQGEVGLQFSLMNAGKTYYVEAKKATPNQYGNISVIIGDGKNKVSGSFDEVPWNTLDVTLKVEVDITGGTNYKLLGETKINPVPYALYAAKGGGAATVNSATKDGESLFQVNDRNGNPVFAVTENGIVVYVDNTESSDKLRRSGFLVTGREATKGEPAKEYFSVTTDGTQIYVDGDDSKLRRSGFLVTGREATKDGSNSREDNYFTVDGTGTKVYVDMDGDDSKLRRSGFLVTGREATKAAPDKLFAIDGGLTTVYIDDPDSYLDGDKLRRSGFLVTGRESKASNGIINITGTRTNLTTTTFSIASAGVSEADEPVSALQITGDNITMNSDMAMEGGVRPALDVDKNEEYNIYISDNYDDAPDDYDEVDVDGDFNFYTYDLLKGSYNWLASFHDTLVVPLTSQDGFLMFNSKGEETAIPQDACVAVSYEYYYDVIKVWPLRKLDNFKVSFALADYWPTSAFGGKADEYARFNVTISSKAAYPGCYFNLGGQQVYTTKVETSQGTFNNVEAGGSYNNEYQVVFGETITLAVTSVPDGQVFDSWRCNGRRYTDSVLHLPITQMSTYIYPVFKDISPVLWVDVNAADGGLGTKDEPYNTIAAALGKIIEENDNTLRGFRINVINSENVTNLERDVINIGDSLNDYAKHITIDFVGTGDFARRISGITDLANIPVIVRNAEVYINESNPEEGSAVLLSGKRLTLDGCLVHGSDGYQKKRGLYVEKGELVMIGGTVNNCKSENGNGGGAYVADGAILTLKNEAALESNTAQKGFGVYLCGGATLNVSNSYTNGNVKKDGDDVYAAGECNFIVSGWSEIGKVGLGNGAYVTRNIEGNDELNTIEFSTIGDPKNQVAKVVGTLPYWMQEDMMDSETFFSEMFKITDQNRLDEGYSSHLKFDGNIGYPFITKKIFSKGTISLMCPNQIDVYYTYYRGEDDEEYLRLKYNWDESDYECHNYWLIGDNVYCDTIYASNGYAQGFAIGSGADLNEYYSDDFSWPAGWDDYGFARTDDFKNLLTVNTSGLSLDEDGNIIDNENKIIAFLNKDIIASCTDNNLFKNILPGFRSLIQRSLCIEGRGSSLDDAQIQQWTQNTYFGDDVNEEIETEDIDFPSYSLQEIEWRFNKLRKGFDVTIFALGGTVTDGNKTYSGIEHLNLKYNTQLTLTVNGQSFLGWSDGVSADVKTREFRIRGDVEIFPLFKQTEFTVSETGPYKSFELVNQIIEKTCNEDDAVTIHVHGTVKGSQTLSENINVQSITIDGADGENPNGVLDARKNGRVLTINTTSHVTIKNLTITRGYVEDGYNYDDGGGNGGGIYNNGGYIILETGAVISGNTASYRGGGIYNYGGTIVMESGSLITNNKTTEGYSDNGGDRGGGGILTIGGEVTINAGATISNNRGGYRGGGIMLFDKAQVTLNGGSIKDNTAGIFGGGVMFGNAPDDNPENEATFTMKSGSIENNKADMDYDRWQGYGGGVYVVWGEFVMQGGSIKNNQAYHAGGGVYVAGPDGINTATLTMEGGDITGNKVLHPSSGQSSGGGGVSNYGEFYMSGGTISGNTFVDSGNGRGIYNNGKLTMSGSATVTGTEGAQKDDIYLNIDEGKVKVIAIGGPLSNANVATITMENYDYEGQVLELAKKDADGTPINTTTLMAEYGKFALTNSNYTIGFDGYINKKITYGENEKSYTKYRINTAERYKNLLDTLNAYPEISTENIYISVEDNLILDNIKPYDPGNEISFKGVFDGNGKTLTINSIDKAQFMVICWRNEGIIQNVKVVTSGGIVCGGVSDAQYSLFSGGICHANMNGGKIRNCWSDVSAEVKFVDPIGGICTHNYQEGVIENCLYTGNITGSMDAVGGVFGIVGGICGANYGTIKNCVDYGEISMKTELISSGTISGSPGAICGFQYSEGSCINCYWRKGCVKSNKSVPTAALDTANFMIFNPLSVDAPNPRQGEVSGCGFFPDFTQGGLTLTPGNVYSCGSNQTLPKYDGTENNKNLLDALNGYVDSNNSVLKGWKTEGQVVVLDFSN